MGLGFRRERNHAVGVLRIGSESPRAFKYHVNVFGRGGFGLTGGWRGLLLGLLTRDEEERSQDSTGQRNQGAVEIAFGSHQGPPGLGIRAVRTLQTPTSSRDEMCAGWPACSGRSGEWHRRRSGQTTHYDQNPVRILEFQQSPLPTGSRPHGAHRRAEERR